MHGVRAARLLELRDASPLAQAVDGQRALSVDDAELDLVAVVLEARDLDPARRDRPEVAVPANGLGPVGRLEVQRVGERSLGLLAEERPVREHREVGLVAAQSRGLRRRDSVPAPRPRDAVDADLTPERTRVDRGRLPQTAALGGPDVPRLPAANG